MRLILSFVPLLFLLVLIPVIYAAFVKLSAKILRFQGITFRHGFAFGFAMTVFSLLVQAMTFFLGHSLPIVFAVTLALAVNLAVGGWFFSRRGSTPNVQSLGWRGGLQLVGLTLLLLGLTGGIFTGVFRGLIT